MKPTAQLLVVAAAVVILWAAPALAFHDAGVAHCNGCHTMHNSEDGQLVDPDSPNGNDWLLRDATPSDVCLSCHGTRLGAVFGTDPLAPPAEKGGGNFVFLLEDNINDAHAGGDPGNEILGERSGHSIVAPSRGVGEDSVLTNAPGGLFPADKLGCTSCHDPHGTDSFRLLYGAGRIIQDGVAVFLNPAPEASGLSIFFGSEANNNHTAYQAGMSEWCANCHGDFHAQAGGTKLIHPSGTPLGGTIAGVYNAYDGTMNQTGSTPATSYLAAVPFEDPGADGGSLNGPSGTSRVMCLTCHRAHATSAPDAGRWDFSVTLLDEDGHESGSYAIPNPYGTPEQRSLCNKCHRKDQFDHGSAD